MQQLALRRAHLQTFFRKDFAAISKNGLKGKDLFLLLLPILCKAKKSSYVS